MRVIAKSHAGLTAISPETGEVRTCELRHCELIPQKVFKNLYPTQFFAEIARLSKDITNRYHKTSDSLLKRIHDPRKRKADTDHEEEPNEPENTQNEMENLEGITEEDLEEYNQNPPPTHNRELRQKRDVHYPK